MTNRHQAAIALNLSYVLHEPSESPVVRQFSANLIRERRRIARLIRRLEALDDSALASRLVLAADDGLETPQADPIQEFVSARVGAWELLPRVLRMFGWLRSPAKQEITFIDDAERADSTSVPLFRANANLCVPPRSTDTKTWMFASAVVRPGGNSLLVRLERVENQHPGIESHRARTEEITRLAEKTIREFVLQWACERPLWDRPAEEALPEFR